jgi:hypothetical protein
MEAVRHVRHGFYVVQVGCHDRIGHGGGQLLQEDALEQRSLYFLRR